MYMQFGLLILSALVCLGNGKDVCNNYGSLYTYCDDGYYCCYNDTSCCKYFWSIGVIVGVVIGCLVGLGFLTAFCCVCVFGHGKSRASTGNIITPASGTQMNVISTGYAQPGPGYAQPPPPPAYGQQGYGVSGSQPPPPYPPQPDSQQKGI